MGGDNAGSLWLKGKGEVLNIQLNLQKLFQDVTPSYCCLVMKKGIHFYIGMNVMQKSEGSNGHQQLLHTPGGRK